MAERSGVAATAVSAQRVRRTVGNATADLWRGRLDNLDGVRARGTVIEHGCSIDASVSARV